jgi:hypothetical protein
MKRARLKDIPHLFVVAHFGLVPDFNVAIHRALVYSNYKKFQECKFKGSFTDRIQSFFGINFIFYSSWPIPRFYGVPEFREKNIHIYRKSQGVYFWVNPDKKMIRYALQRLKKSTILRSNWVNFENVEKLFEIFDIVSPKHINHLNITEFSKSVNLNIQIFDGQHVLFISNTNYKETIYLDTENFTSPSPNYKYLISPSKDYICTKTPWCHYKTKHSTIFKRHQLLKICPWRKRCCSIPTILPNSQQQ